MKSSTFFLNDYGAVPDGVTDATEALQGAIDACHTAGGGVVWVKPGRYLIRPIQLRSHVELHLERGATLLGSADVAAYPNWESTKFNTGLAPYNARYLIIAEEAENIAITGEGEIDGQAAVHYDREGKAARFWKIRDRATRPGRMIFFVLCRNVRIEGVTFRNAPAWTFWVLGCERVRFEGIVIRTPYEAINTDGIDIDCCRDVTISHCDIRTGDDAIILRAIDRMFHTPRVCEQVRVENCSLASNCNAIRLSYLRDGVIRNAVFENITITDSYRGIICQVPQISETPERNQKLDLPPTKGPTVENIRFTNVRVEAKQPVWLRLSDGEPVSGLRNVVFENGVYKGEISSLVKGNDIAEAENILFRNVRWEHHAEGPVLETEKCHNLRFENVVFAQPEVAEAVAQKEVEGAAFENVRTERLATRE